MDLFQRFEVNREPRWQVLTKLAGASLVLHLVFVWMVVYVPAFRDTLNIAALIASTKFVDKDYEATRIGDDVQLVQLSDKFHYPEGYFALESQLAAGQVPGHTAAVDPFAPRIISQASKQSKIDPEASPSPSPAASASPTASPAASPSASAIAQASPSASPLTPEQAQKELEKTAEQNSVTLPDENEINKKVLKDFAAYATELKNQGKLDFEKPFEIEIEAKLDEKGKLKDAKFTKKSGDENLVELFGRLVAALNDSGFLSYLQPISKDNPNATVKITVKQGEKEVLASVTSEASSPERAESLAKALNNLLYFGAGSRAGHDEEVLMKNTNATPDG
ncbi:MAG TPA: hypothetical protein VGC73_00445, partial [Pyrinomonadaceae bacterium]